MGQVPIRTNVESGTAKVVLNDGESEYELKADWAIIIPAGTYHNVINTGDGELKLYTLYSPPNHLKDAIQPTKVDEVEYKFDGRTTP